MINNFLRGQNIKVLDKSQQAKIKGKLLGVVPQISYVCYREISTYMKADGEVKHGIMISCFYDDGSIKYHNIFGEEVQCV